MRSSTFVRRALVVAFASVSIAGLLPAQDAAKDVTKLEEQWAVLYVKKDGAGIGKLLADDYIGGNADGTFASKAQLIKETSSDTAHIVSANYTNLKARAYGNAVVVSAISNITLKGAKGNTVTHYAWTDTWIRQADGRWLCVAAHSTPAK